MELESDAKSEEKLICGLERGIWQILWGLLWGTFIPSRKCMSLIFTWEICAMTMKKDAKFEKELTSSKLT